MSNAAWACNDCDTNNLATADRCRVCDAGRAQAAGAVSEPTLSSQLAPLMRERPVFVESKHAVVAEAPAGSRVRLTSSAPRAPLETPPIPAPPGWPTPSWPSAPLPPPSRPSGGGSRVARRMLWGAILAVAGMLVVGNWSSIISIVEKPGTHRVPPSGPSPSTSAPDCPTLVAKWLPGGGAGAELEAAFDTPRHVITLCRTESGQLFYDGQTKGKAPTPDSHISIPATVTGSGYSARNGVYLYQLSGSEVIVSKSGVELSRQPLTRTGP